MSHAGLAEGEAKTKVRLKFRVSAHDGVTSTGMPEPRWTEKWGVGLFDYEEFHVTDQLLKLPFQENPPKTVCIFSVAGEGLRFRMLDQDRVARVNQKTRTDTIVGIGDRIQIGDTLTLEVLQAPLSSRKSEPAITEAPTIQTDLTDDGPTLTMTTFPGEEATQGAPAVFAKVGPSVEIPDVTDTRPIERPASLSTPQTYLEEKPVELADVPHAARDRSLEGDAFEEDGRSFDPVYAETPKLDASRPSFSERLLSAFAKVLRRDELQPAPDRFPLDESPAKQWEPVTKPWEPAAVSAEAKARQTFFAEPKIELDLPGGTTGKRPPSFDPKPWIPKAEPAGARMRGRAVVFSLSAIATLAVAGSAYVFYENRMKNAEAEAKEAAASGAHSHGFEQGVPLEVIQEKVRRIRGGR